MKRRQITGAALSALVLAIVGASNTAAATRTGRCGPLWTDPANDEAIYALTPFGYQPQVDLIDGTVWTSGATLVVRFNTVDMTTALPLGATGEDWTGYFAVGGQDFGVVANHTLDGDEYWLHTLSPVGDAGGVLTPVSGTLVPGPGGYAEVDVPLALLGSPAAGTGITFESAVAEVNLIDQDDLGVLGYTGDFWTGTASTTVGAGAGCS